MGNPSGDRNISTLKPGLQLYFPKVKPTFNLSKNVGRWRTKNFFSLHAQKIQVGFNIKLKKINFFMMIKVFGSKKSLSGRF